MLEQRIEQHFIDSADLHYQAARGLSKPIAAAVQALMVCVTSGDGKVLACGNGGCAAAAAHFVTGFVGGFERDAGLNWRRWPWPTGALLTAIAAPAFQQMFARQVRALGGRRCAAGHLARRQLRRTGRGVLAAHERRWSSSAHRPWGRPRGAAAARHRCAGVRAARAARRVLEAVQILALHCLCDAVDSQLLGGEDHRFMKLRSMRGVAAGCVVVASPDPRSRLCALLVAVWRRARSSRPTVAHSGAQLEDEGIELRAAGRVREAVGDRAHVNVTSYNRQVLLTGEVPSAQDKALVEQIVSRSRTCAIVNELGVMGRPR